MAEDAKKAAGGKLTCGLVMPISAIDGLSQEHWSDVLKILSEAVEVAGFTPNLVSNADDVGIIQKRIIQNLYENPIVVCDVSGKNPNVMFELGMRLAFDKPTIIVKDDKTQYSFDTSPIEHLEYPRDLRFSRIVEFKQNLAAKIEGTVSAAAKDPKFTTFLKHFGTFQVAKLESKEVSGEKLILEELADLRRLVMEPRRRDAVELRRRPLTTAKGLAETAAAYNSILEAIQEFEATTGLKTAVEAEREKSAIRSYVIKKLDLVHFETFTEFSNAFDKVFGDKYGPSVVG